VRRSLRSADCGRGGLVFGRLSLVLLWIVLTGCSSGVGAERSGPQCAPSEVPHLVLATGEGRIVIELLQSATPDAVDRLIRLVDGPVFHPGIVADHSSADAAGYYDGLVFDLAYPRSSLATSMRPPADSILIQTQIDAEALGLDRRFIETGAESSHVWQFELFPHQAGLSSDDQLHPQMKEWLTLWGERHSADFLIGVSRKQINEALGYEYVAGLNSQKNTRGAVALDPFDATRSTPRLVIVLADAPQYDGRRMVVGRVVSGLEIADAISSRPLIPAKAFKNRPMVPVQIHDSIVECRPSPEPPGSTKGAQ